jgi:hypothetical protein
MAKTWTWTNGYEPEAVALTASDDLTLTADAKRNVVCIALSAASKTVTLGLNDGEVMFVVNNGDTNAFTLANLDGDTGTSVAAGKVALVIASTTADETQIYVLN